MSTLTQKDLKIQSSIPITDIQEFHMEIYKNIHAVFHMEGTLSEEEGKDIVLQPLSGTTVRIYQMMDSICYGMIRYRS